MKRYEVQPETKVSIEYTDTEGDIGEVIQTDVEFVSFQGSHIVIEKKDGTVISYSSTHNDSVIFKKRGYHDRG